MIRFIAYVDPGTGSFALQAAIGAVMGLSFMVRNHIKLFIAKFRKSPKVAEATRPDDVK